MLAPCQFLLVSLPTAHGEVLGTVSLLSLQLAPPSFLPGLHDVPSLVQQITLSPEEVCPLEPVVRGSRLRQATSLPVDL